MLLPWYGQDTDVAGVLLSESWNAWQILSIIAVLLFAIAVIAIAVPRRPASCAAAVRASGSTACWSPLGLLGWRWCCSG